MLKAFSASKFVRRLIYYFSVLVVLLPTSAQGQSLPDSSRFNQNTSVLNDFGLDSTADLENIGNSVEPLPVLDCQEWGYLYKPSKKVIKDFDLVCSRSGLYSCISA